MLLKWELKKLQELLINSSIAPALWNVSCFCIGLQDQLKYLFAVGIEVMDRCSKWKIWKIKSLRQKMWMIHGSVKQTQPLETFYCILSHLTFRQLRSYYTVCILFFKLYLILWSCSHVIKCSLKLDIPIVWICHDLSDIIGSPPHRVVCICNNTAMNILYLDIF